jgi:hypothetical protein
VSSDVVRSDLRSPRREIKYTGSSCQGLEWKDQGIVREGVIVYGGGKAEGKQYGRLDM